MIKSDGEKELEMKFQGVTDFFFCFFECMFFDCCFESQNELINVVLTTVIFQVLYVCLRLSVFCGSL